MTENVSGLSLPGNRLLDIARSRIDTAGTSTAVQKALTQQQKFDQILRGKLENEENDKKLLDACYGMETLFIENLLGSMRKTIPESDFFGKSLAKDIFRDMLYSEYAKIAAKSDQFGLAKQIYEQLSVQNTS